MAKIENSKCGKLFAVIANISMALLVIFVLGFVVCSMLIKTLSDPWGVFYASYGRLISLIGIPVFAVLHVVFNFRKVWATVKELLRKFIIMLKLNPSLIPLAVMLAGFLLFSMNLTDLSNTTAKIQGKGMGLSQFSVMLFSLLSMLCMLNAFPRRKKANIPMIVIMFVMLGVMIFCDVHYMNAINAALTRAESPIIIDQGTAYIAYAYNMLMTHIALLGASAGLVVLLPLYRKLLRKIKTSIDVEGNDDMAAIEINE